MERYKKIKFRNVSVYLVLRFLIILTIIFSILNKEYGNVFTACLALLLFTIPTLINTKSNINLPSMLESIIYIFIFSAQILGEIRDFYITFPYWDTLLHTINGFIFAGIGFSLIELLNRSEKAKIYLSPIYISVVAVLFSVSIGAFWEMFEYSLDIYTNTDTQKDTIVTDVYSVSLSEENKVAKVKNIESTTIKYEDGELLVIEDGYLDIGVIDTMNDMIVNFIGALVFSVFGYFYEKGVSEYAFAKNFIPTKKKEVSR